jgi:hypothetical protein
MVMITLKRRRPLISLSIHDQIQKSRSIGKWRQNQIHIHGNVGRRSRKTTKDGNTSIDLFFFWTQMLVCMPSTSTWWNFCFSLPTITWLLGGQPRFLLIFNKKSMTVCSPRCFILHMLMEKMMKVTALFYLNEVIHALANCSL